jgi:hypothetical protein
MNFKVLLAVFIIIGIAVMLLRTDSGRNYLSSVGNFVSGLFAGAGGDAGGSSGPFGMVMIVDRSAFLSQSFRLQNSSLSVLGLIDSAVDIGGVELRKENIEIEMDLDNVKGTLDYTVAGTLRFEGTVDRAIIDGSSYTLSDRELKVSFEIVPINFVVTGLSERKISLSSATGSIARLNTDGSIKSTEELSAERVDIHRFEGFLELDDTDTKLSGRASSVKGTGLQSSFNW